MLNINQFNKLKEVLNEIVTKTRSVETISIPWLHLIRAHPIFFERYKYLFENNRLLIFLNKIKYFIKNKLVIFYIYFSSFSKKKKTYSYNKVEIPKKIDFLFYSFITHPSQFNSRKDIYFEEIPNYLLKNKKKVYVVITCLFKNSFKLFKKNYKNRSNNKIFLSNFLHIYDEIKIHRKLKSESNILNKKSKNITNKFVKKIYNYLSNEALNLGSHSNLRLAYQFSIILDLCKPKYIFLLYEGHAYERVIISVVRKYSPKTICISYQHSGIFKFSNSVNLLMNKIFNPDIIFTSGRIAKKQIEKKINNTKIKFDVLGSGRGNISNKNKSEFNNFKKTCLVIPEGLLNECYHLFYFSYKCALELPEIKFIWRLHPLIDFTILKTKFNFFKNIPKNIILSEDKFENDIIKSSWVLYRGSSAVFKSISYGLRPIYLKLENEISIDPLYDYKDFKIKISNLKQFKKIINKDIDCKFNYHRKYFKKNVSFCNLNFMKVNYSLLDKL